jgi:hypothetical protein
MHGETVKFWKDGKIRSYSNMLVFYAWEITYGLRECSTGIPEGRKERRRLKKKWGMEVERELKTQYNDKYEEKRLRTSNDCRPETLF